MHSPLARVRDPTADTDAPPRAAEPFDALEHLVGVNLARLRADQPHSLRNPGDTEARAFRVTLKAETPPRWDVPAPQDIARAAAPV